MSDHTDNFYDPQEGLAHHWKSGYHISQNGKRTKISDMLTPHLQNTIKKFENIIDTSVLEEELKKRDV